MFEGVGRSHERVRGSNVRSVSSLILPDSRQVCLKALDDLMNGFVVLMFVQCLR